MSAVVEGIVLVDEKAAPVPGALVSPIRQTPASVQAILGSRASSSVAPPTGWRTLRIRVQLLLAYGLLSLVAFGSLIGICAFITNNSADSVVSTSREELTKQVVDNSILMLGEAGLVLDARLQDGFSVLVQPTTFALYDILGGTSSLVPWHRQPVSSAAPSSASSSPQGADLAGPVRPACRCRLESMVEVLAE